MSDADNPYPDLMEGVVFLLGFMGSGKTHWGKRWAAANQLEFVDLDDVIEARAKMPITAIFETGGEDYFRMLEAEALRDCAAGNRTIVACGGGTPCFFDNMDWMNQNGITIFISADRSDILQRLLAGQQKRPLLKSLDQESLLNYIDDKLKEREPWYNRAHLTVRSYELSENSFPEIITTARSKA
ncbi:MAG: shikimate kinase [Chitinophagaceae bacterium]